MSILRKYPCQIRLHRIDTGDYVPPTHQVIFEVQIPSKNQPLFVSFIFTSIDDMWLYLRNLTRKYGNGAVERLFHGFYPASIELSENFEFISKFEKLYLPDETIWPGAKIHGFILQD